MPLGLFSIGHSTQLGAAVTPVQTNHMLEPLHINTWNFFPLEQPVGTVDTSFVPLSPGERE